MIDHKLNAARVSRNIQALRNIGITPSMAGDVFFLDDCVYQKNYDGTTTRWDRTGHRGVYSVPVEAVLLGSWDRPLKEEQLRALLDTFAAHVPIEPWTQWNADVATNTHRPGDVVVFLDPNKPGKTPFRRTNCVLPGKLYVSRPAPNETISLLVYRPTEEEYTFATDKAWRVYSERINELAAETVYGYIARLREQNTKPRAAEVYAPPAPASLHLALLEADARAPHGKYPYAGQIGGIGYSVLAMAGEAGEAANVVKKAMRSSERLVLESASIASYREALLEEIGDVLWYASAVCRDLGTDLDGAAKLTLAKLEKRRAEAK